MKRSQAVPLLVLGSVAMLESCSPGTPVELRQNRYFAREDCLRDWGSEGACGESPGAPVGGSGGGGGFGGGAGGHGYYYGPRYYWDPDTRKPMTVAPDGTTRPINGARVASEGALRGETMHLGTITRGGFGSIGRGFAKGG